jgi:hypothetical protein
MGVMNSFARSPEDFRVDKLRLAIFLILNGIVLFNACWHDPAVGYDAAEHLNYIEALSAGHLPSSRESAEFFQSSSSLRIPSAPLAPSSRPGPSSG